MTTSKDPRRFQQGFDDMERRFEAIFTELNLSDTQRAALPAAVATANATDLASALTLVNQLKTTVNAMLSALKATP